MIRPVRRRTRRFVAAVAGGIGAWIALCVAAAGSRPAGGLDTSFWSEVLFVGALAGVPAVVWATYLALHNRNRRIVITGDAVELVDWRGGRRTLTAAPDSAARRYHIVFRNSEGRDRYDTLAVVVARATEPPLLLWGSRWEWRTLEPLWSALGIRPVDADDRKAPVPFAQVSANNAHLALPFWWRRSWVVAVLGFVGLAVYVVGLVTGFLLVAQP